MEGRLVELVVYRGTIDDENKSAVGTLNFTRDEWQAFRTFVAGGIRAAGYMRIPISMEDGTRQGPQGIVQS